MNQEDQRDHAEEAANAALMQEPDVLVPIYKDRFQPEFPCHTMPTRHCPAVYAAVCGDRPCARFESNDETPWLPEITG